MRGIPAYRCIYGRAYLTTIRGLFTLSACGWLERMLALARLFDEWRNEKWLRAILDGRRRYVYGQLDEWQCLQTLYDEHAEIALAIDQLPSQVKLPVAILWLLYAVLNKVEGDAKLPDSYKKRLLADIPGYLSSPEGFLSDRTDNHQCI